MTIDINSGITRNRKQRNFIFRQIQEHQRITSPDIFSSFINAKQHYSHVFLQSRQNCRRFFFCNIAGIIRSASCKTEIKSRMKSYKSYRYKKTKCRKKKFSFEPRPNFFSAIFQPFSNHNIHLSKIANKYSTAVL